MANDNNYSLGRIYAQALFELAQAAGTAEAIAEEFQELTNLLRQEHQFAVFLENPAISREAKIRSLEKIFAGRISPLLLNFLKVAGAKDRLGSLPAMNEAYRDLLDEAAGRVRGLLTTAIELGKDEQVRLGEQINRALRKTIKLQNAVNPDILGGMVLTIGDTIIDGSVRTSLHLLAKKMREKSNIKNQISK